MPNSKQPAQTFLSAWLAPAIQRRAIIVAAIVGTALLAINQGDLILAGSWPPLWKIGLTYLVPYLVSSGSAALIAADKH
ncbi:MAG: nitrate/nitrite transporter NrtS [Sphingorhabdus sp.]